VAIVHIPFVVCLFFYFVSLVFYLGFYGYQFYQYSRFRYGNMCIRPIPLPIPCAPCNRHTFKLGLWGVKCIQLSVAKSRNKLCQQHSQRNAAKSHSSLAWLSVAREKRACWHSLDNAIHFYSSFDTNPLYFLTGTNTSTDTSIGISGTLLLFGMTDPQGQL